MVNFTSHGNQLSYHRKKWESNEEKNDRVSKIMKTKSYTMRDAFTLVCSKRETKGKLSLTTYDDF